MLASCSRTIADLAPASLPGPPPPTPPPPPRTHKPTDKYYLRRFLRARQHDLGRAKDMFLAHLKWRQDNAIDGILDDFIFQVRAGGRGGNAVTLPHIELPSRNHLQQQPIPTLLGMQERDAFLSLYPQGYHKTDKMVGGAGAGAVGAATN